jgi:hypothetical protein
MSVPKQPKIRQASTEPGRAPLVRAYRDIEQTAWSRWKQAEDRYLLAMYEFDQLVANGVANQGDRQNGKGDFFNDVVSLLLERCSGKDLYVRPNVPGLSFARHDLDAAYPSSGLVELTIETKATGVPKHPGNTRQKNLAGRPGAADLEKRVKEASLKNIDIKAERAREEGRGGGATADLSEWLKASPPKCYMLLACRVVDENDLERCKYFARIAAAWFDGCGLFPYGLNAARDGYEAKVVKDTGLEMDRVLSRVCTTLRGLP